jgi:5'(3')-deoxyribonucleotidase
MKIGVDIDNVICTTSEAVIEYLNERLPITLSLDDINEYWMEKSIPEQYRWAVSLAFHDSAMWKKVKMIEGAAKGIKTLYKNGNEIFFVTSTTPDNLKKKIKFLKRNLPFLSGNYINDHIITIKQKTLLNLDIMIDDYLDNLIGERSYYSICLAYPWNIKIISEEPNFIRVKNWRDIIITIEKRKLNKLANPIKTYLQ